MIDPSAGELYEKYSSELIRFATLVSGSPAHAEDLMVDAFIAAVSRPGWSSIRHPRAYLYQAIVNHARSQHRSHVRRQARELRAHHMDRAAFIDPPPVRAEVIDAMRRLTIVERAVVYCTYWDDLTAQDCAELLDMSVSSVRRTLRRAQHRLEVLLQ
jgi:RNA polymerase sigma factor (sigma-70 family)